MRAAYAALKAEGEGRIITHYAVGSVGGQELQGHETSVVAEPAGLHAVGGI